MAKPQRTLDPKVKDVLDSFEASYDAKVQMGLHREWRKYEDYCRNKQNPKKDDDHPASVTNIIFPNIASQVADLVDEPQEILVTGEDPSDQHFSSDVKHLLGWIHHHNKMFTKLDRAEWRRLKLGTSPWKVYYDPQGMRGKGFIVVEPISPVNFYPDPKIKQPWELQEGDFIIHAAYKSLTYLENHPVYSKMVRDLRPTTSDKYDLNIFEHEDIEDIKQTINNKVLVLEKWRKGSRNKLIREVVIDEKMIYNSEKDSQLGGKSFYKEGKYPFTVNVCYPVEGRLWGMGDAELLIPTQDLINELDDQIRANAALIGNIQIVVGIASGINIRKWTRKAGLRIPARDHEAWSVVQPPSIPAYITDRRNSGFREGELVSGRSDLVEGRHKGSLRAASAILALQEAGNRRARHKKLNNEHCLGEIYEIAVDYVKEFFDQTQAYRIIGKNPEQPQYMWFKGTSLNEVPRVMPGANDEEGRPTWVAVTDKDGKELKKEAHYDIRISIGAGLPHNKAFLYQAIIELQSRGLITNTEGRVLLRDFLDWPVINPMEPMLNPNVAEPPTSPFIPGMEMGGGSPGPDGEATQTPNQINPALMEQLLGTLGGRGGM